MAKKKPISTQQQYVLDYISKQKEHVAQDDKSRADILEIGCSLVRIWTRKVKILKWRDRKKSVVVEVEGEISTYNWPLHKSVAFPFVNFEVLEDCGYLEMFGNGEEYVIEGKRYGVKGDVVWAGGKRYLSSGEREGFGSFKKFLEGHPEHQKRPAII